MKLKIKLYSILFFTGCILLPNITFGQLKAIQFEDIAALQKIDPRPVVVFIHTDWCRYCQGMKNTTFKNNSIVKLLNNNFYFIDLNAEEKRSIRFHQKIFTYKPTGNNTGVNELAAQLGSHNGQFSYPALCFLNAANEIIHQQHDFTDAKTLKKILERLK